MSLTCTLLQLFERVGVIVFDTADGFHNLSGVELVEKLSASVPPPRGHLVRYLGVLAPNSSWRRQVVLAPKPKSSGRTRHEGGR